MQGSPRITSLESADSRGEHDCSFGYSRRVWAAVGSTNGYPNTADYRRPRSPAWRRRIRLLASIDRPTHSPLRGGLCNLGQIGGQQRSILLAMEGIASVLRPKSDRRRVPREEHCDRYPVQSFTSIAGSASEPASVGLPRRPLRLCETACPICQTGDHVLPLRTPEFTGKRYYCCATCGELWATRLDGTPCF